MEHRLELQEYLIEKSGTPNVYFQHPENLRLSYPAVVYSRNNVSTQYADNRPYKITSGYSVIVIDEDPDSVIVKKLMQLPCCKWNRHYVKDNLNHDIFTLYYK